MLKKKLNICGAAKTEIDETGMIKNNGLLMRKEKLGQIFILHNKSIEYEYIFNIYYLCPPAIPITLIANFCKLDQLSILLISLPKHQTNYFSDQNIFLKRLPPILYFAFKPLGNGVV